MCHLKLVCNMRAQSDPRFADYLLRIGGGTKEVNGDGNVRILDEICVPYSRDAEKDLHTWRTKTTSPPERFYLHVTIGWT